MTVDSDSGAQTKAGALVSTALEIEAAIAAVDPAKLTPSPHVRLSDEVPLGHCDDYLKRLYTVHATLVEEATPLQNEQAALKADIEVAEAWSLAPLVKAFFPEKLKAKKDRLAEVESLLEPLVDLSSVYDSLFWVELKRRLPQTRGKDLALNSDWSVTECLYVPKDLSELRIEVQKLIETMERGFSRFNR